MTVICRQGGFTALERSTKMVPALQRHATATVDSFDAAVMVRSLEKMTSVKRLDLCRRYWW